MPSRPLIALAALLTGALAVALYWTGLAGGFFFDDGPSILKAEGVRLQTISFDSLYQAWLSGGAGPSGRPIAQLSFALNHYFSGFDPFAFKATNLAIHLACGVLVFALMRRLLMANRMPAAQRPALVAAGIAAALWLLHPIQLLPVLHVVQRMTSLSALFLLAAVWLHISAREQGGSAGFVKLTAAWFILWPLSFFSKESGALFPVFVLAWELIVRRSTVGHLDRFARGLATLTGLVLLAATAYLLSPRGQWLWAGYELRGFSLTERVLTEGRVLWFYIGLMLLPRLEAFGLYHDDMALSTSLLTPWTTLPALVGLAGLVWLAWRLRKSAPLAAFGIAWFFIGHALESTVLPLELAHEHRNYLPLFGLLLAAASALPGALQSKGAHKTLGVALACTALVYFPFVTALRAHQFGDEGRRTQIEAQHHRTSPRAQFEAGRVLAGLPDAAQASLPTYSFARRHYELAGELDPNFKMSWLGLMALNCQAGRPVEKAWMDELSHRLKATPFAPGDRTVLYNLKEMAIASANCFTRPEVDSLFAAAVANPSVSPGVQAILHSWHADYLWLQAKDLAAAGQELGQSLALNPGNPSNRLKWAQLLFIAGEREPARQLLLDLRGQNFSADE
ncbi:MAG: pilus assembly protein PilF, partial [Betaproteobacteria bacterium HGW-Betaproteobacteria-18]